MERNPLNANLPTLYRNGIFQNASLNLEPKTTQLRTVSFNGTTVGGNYVFNFEDVGYAAIFPFVIILQNISPKAYAAIMQLWSTSITVGPWATTNGQTGWVTVSGSFTPNGFGYSAPISNWSANVVPNNYATSAGATTNIITTVSTTTQIPCDTNTAITQPYFEIGNDAFKRTYESSWANTTGSNVLYLGDVRPFITPGMIVSEKSYNANTNFNVYNFSLGQYKNCPIDSVASSLTYKRTVVFTSSGTFSKASYPEAKAVRVTAVGGGGGSGAVRATSTNQVATVSGAGAGAATVVWYDINTLDSSCTVTVGSAGLGGATPSSAGSNGGTSTFFASSTPQEVTSASGGNGSSSTAVATPPAANGLTTGGSSTVAGKRFLKIDYFTRANDADGEPSFSLSSTIAIAGGGGGHYLGDNGAPGFSSGSSLGRDGCVYKTGIVDASNFGNPNFYGGGGAGQVNPASRSAIAGRAGQPGVVVVEIYG